MSLTVVKDHEEQGVSLLLEQFKEKPRLEAWLRVYLRQVQLLDDAIYDVLIARMLDYAKNAQLDTIGKLVGERRLGRVDDEYRLFIRTRIQINRSTGSPLDLLAVLALLSSPTPAHFDEYYPASFLIEFVEEPLRDPRTLYRSLQETRAGGVRLNFVSPTTTPDMQFLYSSVGDVSVANNGYGDVNVVASFGLLSTAIGGVPLIASTVTPPVITSISPTSHTTAGGSITITGLNFVAGATASVGGTPCTSVVWNTATSITCIAPSKVPGFYDVVVTNPGGIGSGASGASIYQSIGAPAIFSASPNSGPLTGGSAIVLTGLQFASGATVAIGGSPASSVAWISSTQLSLVTPPGTAGGKSIVVTNPDGQTGSLSPSGFVYVTAPAPTISSLVPTTGPQAGGTAVTINGTGFINGATVTFGGAAATSVVWVSSTRITCVNPAVAPGAYNVYVINPDAQWGALAYGFTYTAPATSGLYTSGVAYRGINRAGAEYGDDWSGWFNQAYYDWPHTNAAGGGTGSAGAWSAELDYYAAKGFNVIRLPISWERIQHTLGGALNTIYANAMVACVTQATTRGFTVVIDVHNYNRFATGTHTSDQGTAQSAVFTQRTLNDGTLTTAHLSDLWSKIAALVVGNSRVMFELMNEPHDFAMTSTAWFAAQNTVIAAIRATGATQRILGSNSRGSDVDHWQQYSPNGGPLDSVAALGVVDSGNNYSYAQHAYWAPGGATPARYASWVALLQETTTWARANGKTMFLTEFGTSVGDGSAQTGAILAFMNANSDVWLGWTPWNLSPYLLTDGNVTDGAQMPWFAPYLTAGTVDGAAPPPPPPPPSTIARGTNFNGMEMGYLNFVQGTGPVPDSNYPVHSTATIDFLASKGVSILRFLFSWEGMQSALNGAIPAAGSGNYKAYYDNYLRIVDYATNVKGMRVLVEPWQSNSSGGAGGAMWRGQLVGGGTVTNAHFADFWTKMSNIFKTNPLVEFGLCNEPNNMSTMQWFTTAQAAITAIRAAGFTGRIQVPGNGWASASAWNSTWYDTAATKRSNAYGWLNAGGVGVRLNDPLSNMVAQVHTYVDSAEGGGASDVSSPTAARDHVNVPVAWGRANGVNIFVGEIGMWAGATNAVACWRDFIAFCDANGDVLLGFTWWACGKRGWWDDVAASGGGHFAITPNASDSAGDTVNMTMIQGDFVPGGGGGGGGGGSFPSNPLTVTADNVVTLNSGLSDYYLFVPNSYDASHNTPMRLLVWGQGTGGTAQGEAWTIGLAGQQHIHICIGGFDGGSFNSNMPLAETYFMAAIADLKTRLNIDPKRVFIGGYSAGGDIAYRTAFNHSLTFAGAFIENSNPFRDTGQSQATALANEAAAGAWRFPIKHLLHTSDTTYPRAETITALAACTSAGHTVTTIEKAGSHYDNDAGAFGTRYDMNTFLTPLVDSSGSVSP